jgi:hypothetical protein
MQDQASFLEQLTTNAARAKCYARAAEHIMSIKTIRQADRSNVKLNTALLCENASDEVMDIIEVMFASMKQNTANILQYLAQGAMVGKEHKVALAELQTNGNYNLLPAVEHNNHAESETDA